MFLLFYYFTTKLYMISQNIYFLTLPKHTHQNEQKKYINLTSQIVSLHEFKKFLILLNCTSP